MKKQENGEAPQEKRIGVIYARYSSERQTEQSIEGQLRVCYEYANRNDIVIVDTYIDRAMTGTNDNRADFQRMLKDSAKRAWDLILVYKLDRFSRNKYETAIHKKTLRDNGVKLISAAENIPDSPEGIILESLLEGMAEYYSAELSQKVRRGMRESRLKGNFTGGRVPYGYRAVDKKIVIEEDEAEIVRRIFREYAGGKFVKDIVADLTREGIYFKGKPFLSGSVYNMLQNEKYAGIFRYKEEVFTNIYPRIVPEEVYRIVRGLAAENKNGTHLPEVCYLLKGKIVCGYCGRPIASESGTARNGETIRYYKCSGRKKLQDCNKATIGKEVLESLVVDTTLQVLNDPDTVELLAERLMDAHKKRIADQTVANLLAEEKQELQKSINNVLSAIDKGIFTASTKKHLEDLESRMEVLEARLLEENAKSRTQMQKEDIKRFIFKAIKKEPKQMIKLLVHHIVLYDDKIEIYYNFTDTKKPDDFEHQAFLIYTGEWEYATNDPAYREMGYKAKLALELYI